MENAPLTGCVLMCSFCFRLFLWKYAGKLDFSGFIRIFLSRKLLLIVALFENPNLSTDVAGLCAHSNAIRA